MNENTREILRQKGYVLGPNGYFKPDKVVVAGPCSSKPEAPVVNTHPNLSTLPSGAMLHAEYLRLGSVHRVGALYGTTGETVRKRIAASGFILKSSKWLPEEIEKLRLAYSQSTISLEALAIQFNRPRIGVALKASKLGIANKRTERRPMSEETKRRLSNSQKNSWTPQRRKKTSETIKKHFSENGHPRGMLGKHHTQEVKDRLAAGMLGTKLDRVRVVKALKTRIARYGTLAHAGRPGASWKQGWREINGRRIFFRSRWEANYGRYLEFLKSTGVIVDWKHEPTTFWFEGIKRGVVSYLPDFLVTYPDGTEEYHEVKGWMDAASKTKIRRMAKYHPKVVLVIRDSTWFKANQSQLRGLVKEWE